MVISESTYRPRVGPVSFLYETTNVLVSDWRRVAAVYAGLFGLDPARFSHDRQRALRLRRHPHPVRSAQPARPHRAQPGHRRRARHGPLRQEASATRSTCATSRCMTGRRCAAACSRPMRATRRAAAIPSTDPDGGWVHPRELHGLLLGISRTGARLGVVGPRGPGARRHEAPASSLLACSAAPLAAQAQPTDWQTVVGRDLRFRLEMPAPAEESKAGEKEKGHAAERIAWACQPRRRHVRLRLRRLRARLVLGARQQGRWRASWAAARPRRRCPPPKYKYLRRRARDPAGLGRLRARRRGARRRRRHDAHLHREGPPVPAARHRQAERAGQGATRPAS